MNDYKKFVICPPEDAISRFMDSLRFQLNGFGYFLQQEDSAVPSFCVHDMEWMYIVSGSSLVRNDGAETRLFPGDLFLLEPEKEYSAQCLGTDPLFYYYLHFDVEPFALREEYIARIFGGGQARRLSGALAPERLNTFDALLKDRVHGEAGTRTLLVCFLTEISVYLMRNAQLTSGEDVIEKHETMEILENARTIIENQLNTRLLLSDVCRTLGVSESYLFKAFKQYFSLSPSQYITLERLKRARSLICEKNMSVAAAAAESGFSSAGYLNRQCRKFYGYSPSKWQKNQSSREDAVQ